MDYCTTNKKNMRHLNNRQSCEVYCGLAESGVHTVAESGVVEDDELTDT